MYKLKCKCLNITIHAQRGGEREADGKTLVSETCKSSFFSREILEVKLAVGGITKEVDTLVQTSRAEDWDIFRCINCETEVYALHAVKGYDRVLVNKELESNPDVIKALTNSTELSPTFKIILKVKSEVKESEEGNPVFGLDPTALSMNAVQEMIKKYLNAEELAMNDRIQQYTAQQQESFSSLKSRAFQDKSAIYRIISDAEETTMTRSIHEAMADTADDFSPDAIPNSSHQREHKFAPPLTSKQTHFHADHRLAASFTPGFPGNRSPLNQRHRPHLHKIHVKSAPGNTSDADPLFALDGFTDDSEPFFESDEDDFSSSDNSFHSEEVPILRHVAALKKPVYSSSVPISLPMGQKAPHSWEEDDVDEVSVPELSKIGESMKALARSVQSTTTDMFGELPRPRVFTEPRPSYSEQK